jgi:hypothetical protein
MSDIVSFSVGFFFCLFIVWVWKKLGDGDKSGWN